MAKPGSLPYEYYVSVTASDGYTVKIRAVCMGPGFTNKDLPKTSPSFLLEVGGGSSAVDLLAL